MQEGLTLCLLCKNRLSSLTEVTWWFSVTHFWNSHEFTDHIRKSSHFYSWKGRIQTLSKAHHIRNTWKNSVTYHIFHLQVTHGWPFCLSQYSVCQVFNKTDPKTNYKTQQLRETRSELWLEMFWRHFFLPDLILAHNSSLKTLCLITVYWWDFPVLNIVKCKHFACSVNSLFFFAILKNASW